jgi:pimeloyl-ACP methyl ester carboxylesterase
MSSTSTLVEHVPSADGTPIACERSGSGPNLVVVNGALSDRRSTAGLRPHLDPHLTVIGYDRRGRGDSGDDARYAPEREMEDLAAVIGATGGQAFVFGQSSGAVLALEAALRGLPISRLVLNEPPYIVGDTRRRPSADLAERLRRLVDAADREAALHLFLKDAIGIPENAVYELQSGPAWPRMLGLAATMAYDVTITDGNELPGIDRLATFPTPTLVTCGEATAPWIQIGTSALAETLPNGRLETLAGQGHTPAPDILASALLRFLTG